MELVQKKNRLSFSDMNKIARNYDELYSRAIALGYEFEQGLYDSSLARDTKIEEIITKIANAEYNLGYLHNKFRFNVPYEPFSVSRRMSHKREMVHQWIDWHLEIYQILFKESLLNDIEGYSISDINGDVIWTLGE